MQVVRCGDEAHAVYIGRPSKYGNPFRIGFDGSRNEVIRMHETWLLSQPHLIAEIRRELRGKTLACYCSPLKCHGDLLLRIANDWQLCFSLEFDNIYDFSR